MAGDRKQFERAQVHWLDLKLSNEYSIDQDSGYMSILVGEMFNDDSWGEERFSDEAYELSSKLARVGIESEVIYDATSDDMDRAIRDYEATDIITIGHGHFYGFFLQDRMYDWKDVSLASTHIKTGSFIQRHCAGLGRDLNVPMGLFVVDGVEKVHTTTVGMGFQPTSLADPVNGTIQPLIIESATYNLIKQIKPLEK